MHRGDMFMQTSEKTGLTATACFCAVNLQFPALSFSPSLIASEKGNSKHIQKPYRQDKFNWQNLHSSRRNHSGSQLHFIFDFQNTGFLCLERVFGSVFTTAMSTNGSLRFLV